MGLRTEIERFPSTSIGAAEVIPLQMAEAYSTFASLGTRVRPQPILRVLNPDGEVLWEPQPERTQVLDSLTARIMVSMLEDVVALGTGYNVRAPDRGALSYEIPAAGKTGTTNDATNVWFMGFTPNLMAAVWFGMDRPMTIWERATGGGDVAPVWGRFMHRVYYGDSTQAHADSVFKARYYPADSLSMDASPESQATPGESAVAAQARGYLLPIPEAWPILSGLISKQVDNRSGLLASRWCPADSAYTELYLPGTEPTEFCDMSGFRIRRNPALRKEAP
jgi:penicillin-binding protein 1A